MTSSPVRSFALAGLLVVGLACSDDDGDGSTPTGPPFEVTESREPCAASDPLRVPLFGDTHAHTALSLDAGTQGTRLRPTDAHRFARGDRVGIQPHDAAGNPQRSLQLARPLDWLAMSDHAEWFGEVFICTTPGAPGHDSGLCELFRDDPDTAFLFMNAFLAFEPDRVRRFDFCGDGGSSCVEQAITL